MCQYRLDLVHCCSLPKANLQIHILFHYIDFCFSDAIADLVCTHSPCCSYLGIEVFRCSQEIEPLVAQQHQQHKRQDKCALLQTDWLCFVLSSVSLEESLA